VTLCVYALTGSAAGLQPRRGEPAPRVPVRGLAGERLHLVRESSLAAVVGHLNAAPRPSAENLRRYDRTLGRLAQSVPALLPARFGTCFESPEELRFVLRSRAATLRGALARVRNRAQMTVRILDRGSPPGPLRPSTPLGDVGGPAAPARGPGATYLNDRAVASARERQVAGFEPVRDAVAKWLRDERVERHGGLITVYHLIPRASAEQYRRTLTRAAASAGFRVVVSGPWPAYAFADTF
jgi:hypothetical protein